MQFSSIRRSVLLAPVGASYVERAARLIVVAVLTAMAVHSTVFALIEWPLGDMGVYLDAGARIREGGALYASTDEIYARYSYAPWFALAWVPLGLLPHWAVAIAWSAALLAATAWVTMHLVQSAPSGAVLALLITPLLFAVSAGGNVQPLVVALLLARLNRADGPLWIALSASLKVTPILFALVYVRQRRFRRAFVAVVLTAVLWMPAPLLGFDVTAQGAWNEFAPSLLGISPWAYGLSVIAACAAVWLVPARLAATSAALGTVLSLPRLFAYDVTLVAVGAALPEDRGDRDEPAAS